MYEPEERLTADQAISHEYFKQYRDSNDEVGEIYGTATNLIQACLDA